MKTFGMIYEYNGSAPRPSRRAKKTRGSTRLLGLALLTLSLGGITGPLLAPARLEANHLITTMRASVNGWKNPEKPLPAAVPVIFNPLTTPDGASIKPVNTEFSLVVPKVGINAAVIPAVNPTDSNEYMEALTKGIAHASTSFFPDEEGTTYLFSHSTNYDWFVSDLNAVFYLLKNLEMDDLMVVFYKGKQYTYKLTDKRVAAPTEVSYLVPQSGAKRLILQTCWPPGSTTERLLIFADLVEEKTIAI